MQLTTYLVLNVCIATFIFFLSYYKSNVKGGKSILLLSFASLLIFTSYLQYALSPSLYTGSVKIALTFFGSTLAAISIFTFSLEYTYRSHWIDRNVILVLAIIPILTQALYWLPNSIDFTEQKIFVPLSIVNIAFLEKVNILYRYSLVISTIWILVRTNFRQPGLFNLQIVSLLAGPLLAFITQMFLLLEMRWNWLGEFYLVSVSLCVVGFAYNIFRKNPNLRLLVERGSVVEKMEDGWIVLDRQNSIIDFNQATTKLAGISREQMYGKPILSVLNDFPGMSNNVVEESQEIEMDKTFKINNEYHYLNIRISTLKDDANTPIGRLVIWRDITNRRRAEDARQQARDEMFVLLNAISNAASQTSNLSEFLTDAIYQIIYPFHSQAILVYLKDDRSNGNIEQEYYLAAHLGFSNESSKMLSKLPESLSLFQWMTKKRQPLLLFKDSQEYHIPEPMKMLEMSCLLAIPLIVQTEAGKKFIGLLILGRKDVPAFKQDDIVRLTILADQIATLIDSDRRRKLSIALSERQRLMRDIHDSVSQKLYGLVTLTEAAQASIDAGSDFDYDRFLSRIGENARQAVKELRLFLFQMQPFDLEKEGLISVLHHRLAAVEGRADIKARFLADEPILLSKEKEVALYYIAQEALNNVLRHAFAKSVTVTLKQGYKYVTLEVVDDGCGFDNTKLDRGGLGLKNIAERVKQENGKLRISSKPGKGTIIKVTFDKDIPRESEEDRLD